jgi:hypothetical protein
MVNSCAVCGCCTRTDNREFEQENEVGRRRRGWQFLPVLHIILNILCLGSGVKTD